MLSGKLSSKISMFDRIDVKMSFTTPELSTWYTNNLNY